MTKDVFPRCTACSPSGQRCWLAPGHAAQGVAHLVLAVTGMPPTVTQMVRVAKSRRDVNPVLLGIVLGAETSGSDMDERLHAFLVAGGVPTLANGPAALLMEIAAFTAREEALAEGAELRTVGDA